MNVGLKMANAAKIRPKLSGAERKRIFEFSAMIIATLLLIGISRLETRLFDLSKSLSSNQDFFTSVIYFGLINLNVILILVLSWLIFRNIAKLVLERKRGVIGSSLRVKLILSLVFFALAPTALMFYISSAFITTSFDTWFSGKVRETMQQTQRAGAKVYEQDQRRLKSLARIALQSVEEKRDAILYPGQIPKLEGKKLAGFGNEYKLDAVRLYDVNGKLVWSNIETDSIGSFLDVQNPRIIDPPSAVAVEQADQSGDLFVVSALERFSDNPGLISRGSVESNQDMDVVKGVAPFYSKIDGRFLGVVLVEEHFETQILKSIQSILTEFADLRHGAQLIRLSYIILLVFMVVIIVFSATWLGFNVARRITGPIQSLAEGTREVALGNYAISIPSRTDDETGQLVRSFNQMTKDLQRNKNLAEESAQSLREGNLELDQRRKYMEVVLKSINAGVISVDPNHCLASVNDSAERLFGISAEDWVGKNLSQIGPSEILGKVWKKVALHLEGQNQYSGQIDYISQENDAVLLLEANRIFDEDGHNLGVVLVADDATEKVKAQKVAAWREVARRIAHEIKNPITPIKLNAQRLQRRYRDKFNGEDKRVFDGCIEAIITQVDALKSMVNEFSKFSRMPAIHATKGKVQVVLREAALFFEMSYPKVKFDGTKISDDLPDIYLDKKQMNRAFMNIISNSISALEKAENPRITFRTERIDRAQVVRVEIEDNGCGIDPQFKDKVIEPYFSTKSDGTGLGLAIVQQIVSDHGGYLRIMPNSEKGTLVVIELPIAGNKFKLSEADTASKDFSDETT